MLRRAFTLIELLIVVAIIAILAAIAVPNFLEAQTRAKVSRCKADMRTLVLGIETYRVDNNRYPLPTDGDGYAMDNPATNTTPWFETKTPVSITTPIAYVTSRLDDVFALRSEDSSHFHYTSIDYLNIRQDNAPTFNNRLIYRNYYRQLKGQDPISVIDYFFLSYGPDLDHDIEAPHAPQPGVSHQHGKGAIYDPTNGTVSSGDIHYMGPGLGFL